MGLLGQVVTLRRPAAKIRLVMLLIQAGLYSRAVGNLGWARGLLLIRRDRARMRSCLNRSWHPASLKTLLSPPQRKTCRSTCTSSPKRTWVGHANLRGHSRMGSRKKMAKGRSSPRIWSVSRRDIGGVTRGAQWLRALARNRLLCRVWIYRRSSFHRSRCREGIDSCKISFC